MKILRYILRFISSIFLQRSKCCNARLVYVHGWNYKLDGLVCSDCKKPI